MLDAGGYLSQLSKQALVDLVLDAVDLARGEGEWDLDDLQDYIAPRMAVRGDRVPSAAAYQAKIDRYRRNLQRAKKGAEK